MEDLNKLVRIIIQRKQRQYPLLDLKGDNTSKENIFFRYIRNGEVKSDDDAARLLYDAEGDDDRYRMLKSRLKQKLLNHLFFLDFTNKNKGTAEQMELECIQFLHQARILQFAGEIKIARSLLQKVLTIAERGEYTNHKIHSLEDLVAILSKNHQPHLFESTFEELTKSRKLFIEEEKARYDYLLMEMMVVKSVNSRRKNMDRVKKTIEKLYHQWKKSNSYNVFEYFMELTILYHKLSGEYEKLMPFLSEVENGSYHGIALNPYRVDRNRIILEKTHVYLKLKEIRKGLDYMSQNEHFFDPKRIEWFSFMETYFLTAMQNHDYQLATRLRENVYASKYFENNDPDCIMKWRIYSAYLQFANSGNFNLIRADYIDLLEKIPEYDKEHEPEQVAILIFQLIYYSAMKDLDAVKARRDALKKYISNHFKENFSYRSRTFYKLLNIVAENNLDGKAIQSKTRYLLKKLPEVQVVSDVYTEMEIIPYEYLWDMLMNIIQSVHSEKIA